MTTKSTPPAGKVADTILTWQERMPAPRKQKYCQMNCSGGQRPCEDCGTETIHGDPIKARDEEIADLRAALARSQPTTADEVGRDDLVPGKMRCAKCDFSLLRTTLNVATGNAYAGDNKTEPCPNGCGPLWPMTWEQEAREGYKLCDNLFERAKAAEDALAARSQPQVEPVADERILAARAEGRAEALEILTGLDAETGIEEYIGWSSPVSPEDEGAAYWDIAKLRDLFGVDDKLFNLFQRAENMYWEYEGKRSELELIARQSSPVAQPVTPLQAPDQAQEQKRPSIDTPEFRKMLLSIREAKHALAIGLRTEKLIEHIDGFLAVSGSAQQAVGATAEASEDARDAAFERHRIEQGKILGTPGLAARPCFQAGWDAAISAMAPQDSAKKEGAA